MSLTHHYVPIGRITYVCIISIVIFIVFFDAHHESIDIFVPRSTVEKW